MKTEDLLETTQNGVIKLTPTARKLFDELMHKGIVNVCWTTGRTWKYSTLHDYRTEMSSLLESKNIPFKLFNDAIRGGKTGWKIKLT